MCVCVRARVHLLHYIMLEHLSLYTLFFLITFSISMYIMCVCLFSALSCRAGALQISIIIIIKREATKQGCNCEYCSPAVPSYLAQAQCSKCKMGPQPLFNRISSDYKSRKKEFMLNLGIHPLPMSLLWVSLSRLLLELRCVWCGLKNCVI